MPTESSLCCNSCGSEKRDTFTAEVALHFRGLDGLEKPIVWVFPSIRACLECGVAEFTIPERELTVLTTGAPAEGAVISVTQKIAKAS